MKTVVSSNKKCRQSYIPKRHDLSLMELFGMINSSKFSVEDEKPTTITRNIYSTCSPAETD